MLLTILTAKMKVISQSDGLAREQNPYQKYLFSDDEYGGRDTLSPKWQKFENEVQSLPLYRDDKQVFEMGNFEVEKVWQYNKNDGSPGLFMGN